MLNPKPQIGQRWLYHNTDDFYVKATTVMEITKVVEYNLYNIKILQINSERGLGLVGQNYCFYIYPEEKRWTYLFGQDKIND